MALFPTKTYSRRNNELSALSEKEKENIDPFDELLSSPLKQDVQFKPLSFWGRNVTDTESKNKSKTIKCGLFETSDSDEHSSPFHRKRKPKARSLVSKRTLQSKITKLSARRNINSTAYSFIKRTKPLKNITSNENNSFKQVNEFEKSKNGLSNKTIYLNENMEETFGGFDNFKCDRTKCFNLDDSTENFYSHPHSVQSNGINNEKINTSNLKYKIYEDFDASQKKTKNTDEKTIITKVESVNSTEQFSDSMEDTLKPFYKNKNNLKFINVKRQFNYPNFFSLPEGNFNCSKQSWDVSESGMTVDWVNDSDKIFAVDDGADDEDECFINSTLVQTSSKTMDNTFDSLNSTTLKTEESEAVSVLECKRKNAFSDSFDFIDFNCSELRGLIEELLVQQNANGQNIATVDLSSTSDDTLSEPNDEDTVIKIALEPETNFVSSQGLGVEEKEFSHSASLSRGVSQLASKISDLTISNASDELSEPETAKPGILQNNSNRADNEDSFSIDLRNVTTKRRGFINNKYEENVPRTYSNRFRSSAAHKKVEKENDSEFELEFDQTFKLPPVTDRMSLDWNKTVSFANPIFESTRVLDISVTDRMISQEQTVLEESKFDHTYVLKPGKKWLRSMSVLKQLQNGNISEGRLESTRITGRKFESFVQEMMEVQNAISKISNKTCTGVNVQNSFSEDLSEYQTVLNFKNDSEVGDFFSVNDSVLTKSIYDKTASEKVLLNRTVKVIQPEEGSSTFRSALGLETSHMSNLEDSVLEKSSYLSARDFILIQCGQEDVLPFEEYFNERTLVNCRKIGEGVYGEVFMCSNTVIKIIPIEGSDKVNGEPQKTFEEIISEVVIASKLSNLRNGEKNQTDGFSEMKRCWCVKGKYPKHLLRLWNEYDELGSGSENDSPVMFKDDQLYIILELANGGKDLESFVFNSAAQSLSVFIQAAFSLAVAEKAFEFEHRDLHWGNVLISETKDKFMTVILDGTEHKIPTKGVKVCIIDFTLSRMNHEGCCIFNDLSVDPGLFASEGDYQFEIYRMMLREVKNDWSLFRPRNNLFWLHYTLDKMIKMVRYKNKKAKAHAKHLKDLKNLEAVVLEYKDSTEFVLSSCLSSVINKL